MAHEVRFRFTIKETGEESVGSGEFSDEEWDALHRFIEHASELAKCRLVQAGVPASLKFSYREGAGISVETSLPDSDDLAAFLHKLRPLILESEPFSFVRIRSLLGKRISNESFRWLLRQLGRHYSGGTLESQIAFESNGVRINSDEMLHRWLNAYEYHRDLDKQAELDVLHRILPLDFSKVLFLTMLTHKTESIFNLWAVVALVLGQRQSLSGALPAA